MRAKNKKGWQGVNHVQNYKIALKNYGFKGISIYEDYFYKGTHDHCKMSPASRIR